MWVGRLRTSRQQEGVERRGLGTNVAGVRNGIWEEGEQGGEARTGIPGLVPSFQGAR